MSILEHSENFPYAVGVLQSKVRRGLGRNCLMITEQDWELAEKTKSALEDGLGREIYEAKVRYSGDGVVKYKKRLVIWNKELMDYLKLITEDNKKVPKFFSKEQEKNYLRGWFDSRASICSTPYKVSPLNYILKYPKIIIFKGTNPELLGSLNSFMNKRVLNSTMSSNYVSLQKINDIKKVIRRRLLTLSRKLRRLTELYENLMEYKNGA